MTIQPSTDGVAPVGVSASTAGPPTGEARRRIPAGFIARFGPLLLLLLLCLLLTIAEPKFASLANITNILNQAAVPLVVAAGITVVILMGSIDLSVEGVVATVCVATSLLVSNTTNSLDLGGFGLLLTLGIGIAFGAVTGVLVTAVKIPSLMVTLGMWFVGLGLASFLYPSRQSAITDEFLRSFALVRVGGLALNFYLAVVVVIVLVIVMRWTRFGRMIYGIGGGEPQLLLAGVRVARYKIIAFTISGLTAAIAGLMVTAQIGLGSVSAGYDQLFPAISAVVIGGTLLSGGKGSILHTVVGVLILEVLQNGMLLLGINPNIQESVIGVALVAIVAIATWRQRSTLRIIK